MQFNGGEQVEEAFKYNRVRIISFDERNILSPKCSFETWAADFIASTVVGKGQAEIRVCTASVMNFPNGEKQRCQESLMREMTHVTCSNAQT